MRAGVLALQGSSEPHLLRLSELSAAPVAVRQRRDLAGVTHLVLPGGESTTIRHLLDLFGLTRELLDRHRDGELCLFGTCAGAILLGRDDGSRPARLGVLDATLTRNAFGRQVDSFATDLSLALPGEEERPFHCVFIRAPRFSAVGPEARVLLRLPAERGGGAPGEPILVQGEGVLAGTFHPELTRDLRIHRAFLGMAPAARRSSRAGAA